MACDEVVSIDNSTIHLAGALGKEAQVLLPASCHWIWGERRSNSYWYGSVCLHRQAKVCDWSKPMTDLREYVLKV